MTSRKVTPNWVAVGPTKQIIQKNARYIDNWLQRNCFKGRTEKSPQIIMIIMFKDFRRLDLNQYCALHADLLLHTVFL